MRLKYIIARFNVRWRRFQQKLDSPKKVEIDITQKSAIELFFALLKSKETTLNHSPESSTIPLI